MAFAGKSSAPASPRSTKKGVTQPYSKQRNTFHGNEHTWFILLAFRKLTSLQMRWHLAFACNLSTANLPVHQRLLNTAVVQLVLRPALTVALIDLAISTCLISKTVMKLDRRRLALRRQNRYDCNGLPGMPFSANCSECCRQRFVPSALRAQLFCTSST